MCRLTLLVLMRLEKAVVLAFRLLEQLKILTVLSRVCRRKLTSILTLVGVLFGKLMTKPDSTVVVGPMLWTRLTRCRKLRDLLNWCTSCNIVGSVRRNDRLKQGVMFIAVLTTDIRLGCTLVGRKHVMCICLRFGALVRLISRSLKSCRLLKLPLQDAEPLSIRPILSMFRLISYVILPIILAGCWEMKEL